MRTWVVILSKNICGHFPGEEKAEGKEGYKRN